MKTRMWLAAAVLLAFSSIAQSQQKEVKIGFIYDVTGPFAGGGSEAALLGTRVRLHLHVSVKDGMQRPRARDE